MRQCRKQQFKKLLAHAGRYDADHSKEGDITTLDVDAIINAANTSLWGCRGVDGAIHRAAGPRLKEACRKMREKCYPQGLHAGEAVAAPGFNLQAEYIIHTVRPIWNRHKGCSPPLVFLLYLPRCSTFSSRFSTSLLPCQ
jgi:O-acetyl-ADP-ribose deacetylase